MRSTFLVSLLAVVSGLAVQASPLPATSDKGSSKPFFDLEGHRGARGEDSEETLYAYASGVLAGVRSLEFDIGITSDGHPVAWHDESIAKEKCKDTKPVTPNDPLFPYVGKYIKQLSLKQIKSLDCGSQRLAAFPLQVTHPGAKIQTLEQVLDFGLCADGPERTLDFNIESKLTPTTPNTTVGPEQFVSTLLSTYRRYNIVDRVTFQSFDWRTIILAKKQEPKIRTVALISYDTLYGSGTLVDNGELSPWLGGISVANQKGPSLSEKIAQAAKEAKASVLSPDHSTYGGEVGDAKFIPFVNATMVNEAHRLGMTLVPYTPDSLFSADKLKADGVDGLITDYPTTFYAWAKGQGLKLPAPGKASRVARCLKQALAKDGQ